MNWSKKKMGILLLSKCGKTWRKWIVAEIVNFNDFEFLLFLMVIKSLKSTTFPAKFLTFISYDLDGQLNKSAALWQLRVWLLFSLLVSFLLFGKMRKDVLQIRFYGKLGVVRILTSQRGFRRLSSIFFSVGIVRDIVPPIILLSTLDWNLLQSHLAWPRFYPLRVWFLNNVTLRWFDRFWWNR